MKNQKPKKWLIRDIIMKPRTPKWKRRFLEKKQAEEYFALHNSERHPLVKKYHKAIHFLKWSIKLLVPDFLIGHPNLWDNLKTLRKHPQFYPLRRALAAWLIFAITFGSLGIYSLQHPVKLLAASPVTDTFTDTSKIATSTNITVDTTAGQVKLSTKSNWLTGWTYRRAITVDNTTNSSSLTNYQVKVSLNSTNFNFSHANSDGSDIRFTNSDGTTLIDFWIEKWDSANSVATLWVEVPSIPASATETIYMYYGNPSATSASDGNATFLFFDDMETWTGWTQYGNGQVSQDSTRAYEGTYSAHKTTDNDQHGAYKALPATLGRNIILEAMVNRNSASTGGAADRVGLIDDSGNGYGVGYFHNTNQTNIDVRSNYSPTMTFGSGSTDHMDDWYKLVMKITPSNIVAEKWYGGTLEETVSKTDTTYSSFTRFYIFGGYDYWVDLVRIRKYTSPEPTTSVGGEETKYYQSGNFTSTNLLAGETVSSIDNFVYNLSALPANTTSTVQFSQNGTDWYNSSGVLGGSDTMATGTNQTIDLSGLGWSGPNFYYKITFTSDGVDTPVLDDISVYYTSNQPPDTPTNVSPSAGATGVGLNPDLVGSAFSDPESDSHTDTQWQVDDDADFATPVWTRTAGAAETSTQVATSTGTFANELAGKTELDHNTTYYWRVRYSDGAWSNWSTSTSFTTNLVNSPSNSSPANGATLTSLTPLLEASAFSDDQSGHTHAASQWLIDDNSDFSSPVYDSGETTSAETSRAVPGGTLSNYTTYYWKVRYKDSSGFWSNYSTPTSFSIQISETAVEVRPVFGNTTVDQGDTVKIDVQVINFTDGSPLNNATSTINIYDPSGTKIVDGATMTYVTGSNGIYRYSYTVPSTSGSYLYEVTATQGNKSGYGASNFEVRTIASDVSSIKSTVESEQAAQATSRAEVSQIKKDVDILVGAFIVTQGTVNDASASTTAFVSSLTNSTDDFYNNAVLTFTSGALDGQSRRISDYDGTLKKITLDPPLTSAPANGDAFTIVMQNVRVEEQVAQHETSQAAFRSDTTSRLIDIESKIDTLTANLNTVDTNLDSVLSTVNSIRASQQKDYSELLRARKDLELNSQKLARVLEILDIINPAMQKLLSVNTLNTESLIDIQNKVADLKAVSSAIRRIVEQQSVEPIVETYMKFNSVEIHFLITNPADTAQTVKFKAFLPEEVRPEHILDKSGLKVDYDANAAVYYVSGDFTLGPKETVTRKVEIKDIWGFAPEEIKSIKDQAESLTKTLTKTPYEAQGTILKNDIDSSLNIVLLRQEESYSSPQDHIVVYRENKERMTQAKKNLEKLKDLAVQAGASRGVVGQVGGIQTFATWGIILAIVSGFGLLAAVIFAMWRHQTMLAAAAMGMSRKDISAHFGGVLSRSRRRKLAKRKPSAETRSRSVYESFIWRLSWKRILIWFAVFVFLAVLVILAIKFAPDLFRSKKMVFENKETPAVAPVAPQEKSIGSKLVPETSGNAEMSFGAESSNPKLKILDTPTGWLNVRDNPSLEGKVITKVYPGEKYEYTDKQNGWYKIILNDKTTGWVYEKYVQTIGD